jgi:hypothetical protein
MYALAKWTNPLKPFSVYFGEFLEDIEQSERKVRDNAHMATMEKIKGINQLAPWLFQQVGMTGNIDWEVSDQILHNRQFQTSSRDTKAVGRIEGRDGSSIGEDRWWVKLHPGFLCRHA